MFFPTTETCLFASFYSSLEETCSPGSFDAPNYMPPHMNKPASQSHPGIGLQLLKPSYAISDSPTALARLGQCIYYLFKYLRISFHIKTEIINLS